MTSTSEPYHVPVMLPEVIRALEIRSDGLYVDFTAGGGSHSLAILDALGSGGRLIAGDRDAAAVQAATVRLSQSASRAAWQVRHASFAQLAGDLIAEGVKADGILADLGVSSHQLDTPERGYSYRSDGPLDMRMDQRQAETAASLVNTWTADRLSDIFRRYGEERHATRIAGAIVRRRRERPFERTLELAETVANAMPAASRREAQHPARRVFQALRIAVNGELSELETLLDRLPLLLNRPGRVLIITFHSLEDRLVKQTMQTWQSPCRCPRGLPCTCGRKPLGAVIEKGGLTAADDEQQENSRARSARLRIFEMREEH